MLKGIRLKQIAAEWISVLAWQGVLGAPTRWALRNRFYVPPSQKKLKKLNEGAAHVGPATKSLHAYVPITGKHTYLYIYNFLGVNYGARGPAHLCFTVLKNDLIVRQFNRSIDMDSVICVGGENTAVFGVEEGHVVCELSHAHLRPSPRQNHLRFVVVYRDRDLGSITSVHSNVVPPLIPVGGTQSGRNYIPLPALECGVILTHGSSQNIARVSELTRHPQEGYARPARHSPIGYNFLKSIDESLPDARYSVLSAWHDSELHPVVGRDAAGSDGYQALFIPHFERCAPFLQFSSDQLGVDKPDILLSLYPLGSREPHAVKSLTLAASAQIIDLQSLFAGFSGHALCHITIQNAISKGFPKPILYVHAFYRSALGVSDNVHSAATQFSSQNGSLPVLKDSDELPRRSCRKWGLHLVEPGLESWLAIVLDSHCSPTRIPPLKVRLFTDTGVEGLCYLELPNLPGFAIRATQLLSDAGIECERFFFAQIEHPNYNFPAYYYNVDLKTHAVAVDHYTGG